MTVLKDKIKVIKSVTPTLGLNKKMEYLKNLKFQKLLKVNHLIQEL